MTQKPRIPTPESIRQSMDDLRGGKLSEVEYETRQEVLALAQVRVEAILSDEVRALFAQYSPQIIEAYGLLLRWQAERDGYPQSGDVGRRGTDFIRSGAIRGAGAATCLLRFRRWHGHNVRG